MSAPDNANGALLPPKVDGQSSMASSKQENTFISVDEQELEKTREKAYPSTSGPPKSLVNSDGSMKPIPPPKNVNVDQFFPDIDAGVSKNITYGEVLIPPAEKNKLQHTECLPITEEESAGEKESLAAESEISDSHVSGTEKDGSETTLGKENSDEVFPTQVDEETIEAAKRRSFKPQNILFQPEGWAPSREGTTLQQVVYERAGEHFDEGQDHISASDFEKAIVSLTKAINLKPKDIDFYVQRAECYLRICDFQSAILNYKRACVLDPKNPAFFNRLAFAYYFQGQCLFDQKLFPEALESFSRAAEMRPEVIGYHTRSIACLASLERHGECLALVNRRLEHEQDSADLYVMRARLHKLFRNTTLCYYDVKDALAINPQHSEANKFMKNLEDRSFELKRQALNLSLLGRNRDSLQKISLAIETNPAVAEFHNLRGALHRRLGDFNAAIDDYLLALDKTDHNEESPVYQEAQRQLLLTYNDFAVECFTKGFYEEAIILLNKAIKGEKKEKGLYINRGDCFFREGNLQFAMADYQQALEFDQRDEAIRARIAVIHNEHGVEEYNNKKYQEAESRITLAIQHNPKMGQYYVSRARVRHNIENMSGARQDVLMALLLDPTNDEMMAMLSRMFPGKTVKDILQSRAAHHAREALTNLVVTASPVRLDPLTYLKGEDHEEAEVTGKRGTQPSLVSGSNWQGDLVPSFKTCMKDKEFNIKIAREKRQTNNMVKEALHGRKSLKHTGGRLTEMPDAVPYTKMGGTSPLSKASITIKPPAGWKKFSRRQVTNGGD